MAEQRLRWLGSAYFPGSALMALLAGAAWFERYRLHAWVMANPVGVPAVMAGLPVLMGVMGAGLWLEHGALSRAWRLRAASRAGLPGLAEPPAWLQWLRHRPDPLAWLTRPLFRTAWGGRLGQRWLSAGFESHPSRLVLLILGAAMVGWIIGARIAGPILGIALAGAAPLAPTRWVDSRGEVRRRQFDDQIPMALDALAAGLAAGLSFQQAIRFAAEELPAPMSLVLERMDIRLRLGLPVEEALDILQQAHPEEMTALAVEGIQLQRQYGGDLVRMLGESADLLRGRLELEREVRAVTSQGRLSGAVVAGLVPVSAGLLLLTNPRYIDVLFDTLPGQILLVLALLLQLTGWAILSRLVRIRY